MVTIPFTRFVAVVVVVLALSGARFGLTLCVDLAPMTAQVVKCIYPVKIGTGTGKLQ
jgi:hypothetical protein